MEYPLVILKCISVIGHVLPSVERSILPGLNLPLTK